MSAVRILILIIPIIATAITLAIALSKSKKASISSSDIFISLLPLIIGDVLALFITFFIHLPFGPAILIVVASIVISAVLLGSKLQIGRAHV